MNQAKGIFPVNRLLKGVLFSLAAIAMLAIVVTLVFRPRIFEFHANILSNQGVSGKVFESADGIFIVRLDSGSQLTVRQNPAKVFLLANSKRAGFCIGNFLVLPASKIGGLDLSESESFDRQVPVIKDGMVTLKDPLKENGMFSFPLKN